MSSLGGEGGMTATSREAIPRATTLRVWKRTGTHGDTLIAWGLALLANDVTRRPVTLRNTPGAFEIDVRGSLADIQEACEGWSPSDRVKLPWLACAASGRNPPDDVSYAVDRDLLRDDHALLREMRQQPAVSGDAPAVAAHPLAPRYPLFQVLTNPGTQWAGYNTLAARVSGLWSGAGAGALLSTFAEGRESSALDSSLDSVMERLGVRRGDRRVNPPGFLFPGANKGPTMRIERRGVVTGQTGALDWMMADRGDLSVAELYLAYVGYFSVAHVHSYKGGRVVSVPIPERAIVPRVIDVLARVQPRSFSASPAATAAHAALRYGNAALEYHVALMREEQGDPPRQLVLAGVQHAVYWMPSGNTYAPQSATVVPLPFWLQPLFDREGFDEARATVEAHERRVEGVGRAEGAEARVAANLYREALSGDARDWLMVIPHWYRAVLAERYVSSWSADEIERIAVSLQPELSEIIHDSAFESLTRAIRRVTIAAYYARQSGRTAAVGNVPRPDRPDSPLSPQYDLIGSLQEAAARHPDEFLRELCGFVAAYNDEIARGRLKLPLIRKEDIEQLISWLAADRRGLIPPLLLAFGVSPRRRVAGVAEDEAPPDPEGAAAGVEE